MENNLPKGWAEIPPFAIAEKIRGVSYNKDEISFTPENGLIPVIRANSIEDNHLIYKELVYVPEKEISKNQILQKGDVVIAMSSGSKNLVGKTAQYFDEVKISFGAFCGVLRPCKSINSKYFGYYFQSKEYRNIISELSAGTNINNLKNEHFEALKIPLSPLSEQHRIVAKLDAVFEKIESNKQRLDKIPKLLKRFRQSVLADAVSGKLTEDWREKNTDVESANVLLKHIQQLRKEWSKIDIKDGNNEAKRILSKLEKHSFEDLKEPVPETWCYSSLLKACLLVVDCHNKTAPYVDEGIYLVRTTNIKDGRIIYEDIRYVSQNTYEYWSRRCPPTEDDIIFTREAPMGEAAIIPQGIKVCLGQRTMLLKIPKGLLFNQFLLYSLMAPKMAEQITDKAIGSGVKHLRVGDVESLVIALPPLKEQQEIVRRVEKLFATADKLEARYTKAKAMLDKLPQSILAKAFRGELVPQDPNDEPASVLLERIAAEKRSTELTPKSSTSKGKKGKAVKRTNA